MAIYSISIEDTVYRDKMSPVEYDKYIVANAVAAIWRHEKSDLLFEIFAEKLMSRYGGSLEIAVSDWLRNHL